MTAPVRYRVIIRPDAWVVKCPAIGEIRIPRDGRWKFDGNLERPTFTPSVNETWGREGQTLEELRRDPSPNRNHVFITAGRIEYLSDCTHSRSGTTVEVPALSYAEMRMHYPDVVSARDSDE